MESKKSRKVLSLEWKNDGVTDDNSGDDDFVLNTFINFKPEYDVEFGERPYCAAVCL